jgi:hypothetical protein
MEENKLSKEYEEALRVVRLASQEYNEACKKYRKREIDTPMYLEARKKYQAASADFDKAYTEEENRGLQN